MDFFCPYNHKLLTIIHLHALKRDIYPAIFSKSRKSRANTHKKGAGSLGKLPASLDTVPRASGVYPSFHGSLYS